MNYYIPKSANLFWEFIKNLQILVSCQSWEDFPFIMIHCIFKSMLNYWHPLETLDSTFPILQDAYITSKTLFESKTTSWYGSIHTILEQIPEIKNLDQLCIKLSSFKNKAKIHLKSKFIELWRNQMLQQTNGKLKSYITFKSNFGREKYLSVLKMF